ncbi:hypothetical protein [Bifidobacterium callitrichos]|uniref:hypothetical protein n=1 Tax=Bifidobacterium callitrichos TaxID=762209 RepID=UPI00136210F8|nr:hypothetical protein [Bifidobacterium callitrichos]
MIVREAMRIPLNLLIPSLGIGNGNQAGINVYAALVGGSGSGKDTTDRTAAAIVPDILGAGVHVPVSGEGLAAMFAARIPELDENGKKTGLSHQTCINPRALLSVSEVSQLSGAAKISSSTLIATMLTQFMGYRFGAFNKSVDNRLEIPDFAYRLCLTVNAQPDSADVFVENEGKGFPQRFLWADVLDPDCDTDYDHRTPLPKGEFTWHVNYEHVTLNALADLYEAGDWTTYMATHTPGPDTIELTTLKYPKIAYRDAFEDSVRRNRGTRAKRDSHVMLLTAHVAAVVASMRASDLKVTADDWSIAKAIVEESNRIRERYLASARDSITDREAEDMALKDEARERNDIRIAEKARVRIVKVLTERDPHRVGMPERELRGLLNSTQRRQFLPALDSLKAEGVIEWTEGPEGGKLYSLSMKDE